MEKTKEQLISYREMLWQMEMDRLIDMGKDYSIEFREGALIINGHVQPPSIKDKYRTYFIGEESRIFKRTGFPSTGSFRLV